MMDPGMTGDQIAALLSAAECTPADDGWVKLDKHTLTLHTAFGGASLSLGRIASIKQDGALVYAKTARGETHVVRIDDVFAGTVEASKEKGRKAGFV